MKNAVITHEPYSFDKEELKEYLGAEYNISNSVFFFIMDRVIHCQKFIEPNLNKMVLCDRYIYSTYAYDGVNYAKKYNTTIEDGVEIIKIFSNLLLNIFGQTICEPDLVFYIKTDPHNSVIRKGEDLEYMKLVSDAYDYIFSSMQNCIIIDGSNPIKEIVAEVEQYILGVGDTIHQ
jgi:thymidylate kinase